MKNAFLVGNKIYLRSLHESDIEGNYPKWFDDPEVCKYNDHVPFTKTKQDFIDYVKKVSESKNDYVFAICDVKNDKHVGNISLQKINHNYRNGELAIIIGERDYWGKGVGGEAWRLLMDFGFNVLKLHRLYCGTHEENLGMQKIALSCGMKEEGRLKHAIFKNNKYSDAILYSYINPKE